MADTFGGAKGSPYYGIPDVGNIDINKIGGRKGPDYIPYNQKGRDPFGRVSFNTGIFWLGGFVVGGLKGVAEQTRTPCPSWRLRINSVLNGVSKTGSLWGNSLGVAGKSRRTYILSKS
jgi:import inner membrane translocase subunit TIM23